VYQLVGDVLKDVDALFKDSDYIHLGGDEVSGACWDLVPAIKTFMLAHNIKSYGELQMYWRKELRKNLSPTRKVVFWKNTNGNVSIGEDEVLHYWGAQNATADCNEYKII
jgi:hexosaminidase